MISISEGAVVIRRALRRDGWVGGQMRLPRLCGIWVSAPDHATEAHGRLSYASQCNQVWAPDFMHDQLATGRKIRACIRRNLLELLVADRSALQLHGMLWVVPA
jgi:hypothetical protein